MREGEAGMSDFEGRRVFPKDTVLYRALGCWNIYISRGKKYMMIDTTDYHPGLLYITKRDLEKILMELSAGNVRVR